MFSRSNFGFSKTLKALKGYEDLPKNKSRIIKKRDILTVDSKNADFLDIDREWINDQQSETASFISYRSDSITAKKFKLPSAKMLPLISFGFFLVSNILPIMVACSFSSDSSCLKIKSLNLSSSLQWLFLIGSICSAVTSVGSIGVLYAYMKKRFSVPEYISNVKYLNMSYPIGILSILSYLVYMTSQLQLPTQQLQTREDAFLKIHLVTILVYNSINLYLLGNLTKDRMFSSHVCDSFLYKFKRTIFGISCFTIAISLCTDVLLLMFSGMEYSEFLQSFANVSAIITIIINQTYLALYYVDMKLIEYQFNSRIEEDYFFNKRMANSDPLFL